MPKSLLDQLKDVTVVVAVVVRLAEPLTTLAESPLTNPLRVLLKVGLAVSKTLVARFAVTVDFPTPPLPEAIATLYLTSLRISPVGIGAGTAGWCWR